MRRWQNLISKNAYRQQRTGLFDTSRDSAFQGLSNDAKIGQIDVCDN
ncbi:MAG: hypothetical protein GY820_41795 [Gammaproteobacteria bacterium]|nr:hypothetical protein [Gammaproteobacteria bacterium]